MSEFTIRGSQLRLGDRRIGWITKTMNGKKAYVSPRNRIGKKGHGHYFENFKGFGIAVSVLEFLKRNMFDEVHLRIGKRETLISQLSDWENHGIPYRRKPFEEQIILPERFMDKKFLPLSEVMEQ